MTFPFSAITDQNGGTTGDRRLLVVVFALFFSWLLAVPFEGQVFYTIAHTRGASAQSLVFGAMAAHFAGLIACGFFIRSMRAAKKLVLFSIAFCMATTAVLFFPPSPAWTVALLVAAFLVGCCVSAWGYYFRACAAKEERTKTIADGLIFSNLLMIVLNMIAIHVSPVAGLICALLTLGAAFLCALRLPAQHSPATTAPKSDHRIAPGYGALAFLCVFIVVVTIDSGLMYQVINPAFAHMEWLTSWYWAVPYIAALLVMRTISGKINRSNVLYIALAMIGFSFILFILSGRSWPHYLAINTLMLGACGIYDLFWWGTLGDLLELNKNPSRIIGVGLAANVFGVLLGKLIGQVLTAIGSEQSYTLLALSIVCATLAMLAPLSNQLTKILDRPASPPAPAPTSAPGPTPEAQQALTLDKLDPFKRLTEREHEVTLLLIKGKSNKEIAALLFIVESTVKYHVSNIYAKTGVGSRTELANLILSGPDTSPEP